jgi:hypothetical protein
MSDYAATTKVCVNDSRMEIETTLLRFGCVNAVAAAIDGIARVLFQREGLPYDMSIPLPSPGAREFEYRKCGTGWAHRNIAEQTHAYEQACRVTWRKLALLIKAKCVALSDMQGGVTFEQEFLAYARLPRGGTVGSFTIPQLKDIAANGEQALLIPRVALPGRSET